MSRIPTNATKKDIFDTITEGKMYSLFLVLPKPGRFGKCAAEIAFQERHVVDQYFDKAVPPSGNRICGELVRVDWNRNRVWPCNAVELYQSRVLLIYGP